MSDAPHTLKNGKVIKEYFPPIYQDFLHEIYSHHPELVAQWEEMDRNNEGDAELKIAAVCTYCKIALDGTFTPGQITDIVELCLRKLREKSCILILPSSTSWTS